MYRPGSDSDADTAEPGGTPEGSKETQIEWAVGSVTPAPGAQVLALASTVARQTLASHPAPATRDPIGQLVGSYRILRALGRGGCGAVWLAEHEVIKSKVAIKILRSDVVSIPGVQERFVTEARASSTIPSPHVAKYTDLGQLPTGEPYAVMEYLEGETVHGRIKRLGQLSLADALAITRQAAETLALAHDASIIHRDIKPENIFLVGDGPPNIKVLDFGIAKLVGDAMKTSALETAAGAFVGTPAYCAPEQLVGGATTTAVDMYALGTTLYEMLAGSLPYDIASPEFLVSKISDAPPRVRSVRADVPERLDALVASMLAASPTARPATMRALLAELEHVQEPVVRRRRKSLWIAAAALVVAGAIGAAVMASGDTPKPTSSASPAPSSAPVPAPTEPSALGPVAAPVAVPAPVPAPAEIPVRKVTKQRPTASRTAAPSSEAPANQPDTSADKPADKPASTGKPDVIMADPFE